MILKFYYRIDGIVENPLVAEVHTEDCADPAVSGTPGEIKFYPFDLSPLAGVDDNWVRQDRLFRSQLAIQLNRPITAMHRKSLQPWSRLAFENIVNYPWGLLGSFTIAKLFEDDGSQWDSSRAIPLYGPDPGPYGKDGVLPPSQNPRTHGRIYPNRKPETDNSG
jgi:hypothetical protein